MLAAYRIEQERKYIGTTMRADTLYKTICEEPDVRLDVSSKAEENSPSLLLTTFTICLLLLLSLEVSVLLKV